MSELEDKLQLALANVENAKHIIQDMKKECTTEPECSMLTNYNLELLDLKLRLRDMITHLPKLEGLI